MKRLEKRLAQIVGGVSGALLLIFALTIGLVYCSVSMNGKEFVSYHASTVVFWLTAALMAFAAWHMRRWTPQRIRRLSPAALFALGSLCWLAGGLYLMLNIDHSYIAADVMHCHDTAAAFLQGDYSRFFFPGYIDKNPHQLGLVSMILLLYHVSRSYTLFQAVYLAMILLINFFVWKCSEEAFGREHPAIRWIVALSFLFLPLLFYVLFLYNNIPSLCLQMAAIYGLLRFEKKRSIGWAAVAVGCLTLACVIRTNAIIAAIAMVCICVLWLMREPKRWGSLVLAGCLIVCPLAAQNGVRQYYRQATGAPLPGGTPMTGYIMMGLQEGARANGWYTDYSQKLNNLGGDPSVQAAVAKRDVVNRLGEFAADPIYAAEFFGKKILSTWMEPTYESLVSGPSSEGGAECRTGLLMSLYGGGKAWKLYNFLTRLLAFFLYLLSGLYPFLRSRVEKQRMGTLELLGLVLFMGGFLFHLFWETKSQYVFGYIVTLLPLAGRSAELLLRGRGHKIQSVEEE